MDLSKLYESNARTYVRKFDKMFVSGSGVKLTDASGTVYTDCLACAGALPLGHNHPVFKVAIQEYVDSDLPQQMLDLMTPAKRDYILEVKQWFPPEMQDFKIQFCSPSGSDAVEAALKLCRIATGRQNVISFSGGYHGQTLGALLCMGNKKVKNVMNLTNMNNHVMPYPNKYHWFEQNIPEDKMIESSLLMLEQLFTDDESGVALPAAIIVECVQGEGGVAVAPEKWVRGLRELCTKYNVAMIADEVQSGWMRTGKPFAFNWSDVIPDVVVLSKAAGGGQPMAFITYDSKFDKWSSGAHTGTFRGNQVAMVTGKHVLNYVRTSGLQEKVRNTGDYLTRELKKIQVDYPHVISEIRGLGLMLGIQIGDGYAYNGALAEKIQKKLFAEHNIIIERGGRDGSVMRFLTSLEIDLVDLDHVISSIRSVLGEIHS
jgi:diaminobutyrate-2-oxoglutarate transaminase